MHSWSWRALLGLHVFSGCDQVEKMAIITKARVMKLFMLPLTTHAALESFCNLSLSTGLSEFIMQLYSSHRYLTLVFLDGSCSPSRTTLEIDYFPVPKWEALKCHILRANFVARMCHLNEVSFNPVIPSPGDTGWVL